MLSSRCPAELGGLDLGDRHRLARLPELRLEPELLLGALAKLRCDVSRRRSSSAARQRSRAPLELVAEAAAAPARARPSAGRVSLLQRDPPLELLAVVEALLAARRLGASAWRRSAASSASSLARWIAPDPEPSSARSAWRSASQVVRLASSAASSSARRASRSARWDSSSRLRASARAESARSRSRLARSSVCSRWASRDASSSRSERAASAGSVPSRGSLRISPAAGVVALAVDRDGHAARNPRRARRGRPRARRRRAGAR